MNNLRKDKRILFKDKLTCTDSPIIEKDLLIQILNGLRPDYLDLALIITANKMAYNDAYALLLTYEVGLEQNQNVKTIRCFSYCRVFYK